jgi:hypothetical protein
MRSNFRAKQVAVQKVHFRVNCAEIKAPRMLILQHSWGFLFFLVTGLNYHFSDSLFFLNLLPTWLRNVNLNIIRP